MAIVQDCPNEVVLQFFPHFCLKSLIAARGVCRLWKMLIRLADIHPTRRRLLLLYKRLIRSPAFLPTRPWTLAHLISFNRQAYVDELLLYNQVDIPEEFRLWVLEWPARAAINCIWPGLPSDYCMGAMLPLDRNEGFNVLGYSLPSVDPIPSPSVYVIKFNYDSHSAWHKPCKETLDRDSSDDENFSDVIGHVSAEATCAAKGGMVLEEDVRPPEDLEKVPALLVHRSWINNTWLVLDSKRDVPFAVYAFDDDEYNGDDGETYVCSSWLSWLHVQLSNIELRVQHNDRGAMASGENTPPPVEFEEWSKVVV
ncbi:hypothetical protein B0H11DRAFT_1334302 [Mycena galericulata]|nr:hypothetical protein B0H11DRAFT_1334302 [Mycena galericulata]